MLKFRLLTADDIECKVKSCKENGLILLLYKTARTDMDILDETVGAENWDCDYKEIKGNLYCDIGIRFETASGERWVHKSDCGIESREDEDGNQKKGEASDAFKRAGFKWGIGRELYSAPFIWIDAADTKIEMLKGRPRCNDFFKVESIGYNDKRQIISLVIVNVRTGAICFDMNKKCKQKQKTAPAPARAPTAQKKQNAKQKIYVCEDCGHEVTGYTIGDIEFSLDDHLKACKRSFNGHVLCYPCAMERLNAEHDQHTDG